MPVQENENLARQANLDLVDRLTLWLDERINEHPEGLFHPEVHVITPGGTAVGVEDAIAQARRMHNASAVSQHFTTNVLVAVAPNSATVRANFLAAYAPAVMEEPARLIGGLYLLRTEVFGEGWRIRQLEVRPLWRRSDA
jgi:hypothetical protein